MLRLLFFAFVLLLVASVARAADIEGTVRNASAAKASIVIPMDVLPNVGDKVDFFSVAPGSTNEVPVGSGSVGTVSPDAVIEVNIEQATGEISKDDIVRIIRKRR